MIDLGFPFRRVLVALLAAWLPLACCCGALAGDGHGVEEPAPAAAHGCCPSDAEHPDQQSDAPADDACACDGDSRVATVADAPILPAEAPLVGVLPFWGGDLSPATELLGRSCPVSLPGDSPPPVAPSLRALRILILV